MRLRTSVVLVLLFTLTLVACSSSKSSLSSSSSSSSSSAAPSSASSASSSSVTSAAPSGGLTASFRGVTPTTIKLGIVTVDYTCIKQFVDYNFGNQPEIDQIFINELNAEDYPTVVALVLIGGVLTVIGNLVADIALSVADPRIRIA